MSASFAEGNFETYLWLSKFVKYNGKSMFIKEFSDAEILNAPQILAQMVFIKHMMMWQ